MDSVQIKIAKWSKYNRRSDYVHPWWFAISNRMLEDPSFLAVTDAELRAWIYILSQASQKNTDSPTLYFEHADRVCKVPKKSLISCIYKLEVMGAVGICTDSVRDPTESERDPTDPEHDLAATIQDKTKQNMSQSRASATHPLVELWEEERGQLAGVRGVNGDRAKSLKARWQENPSAEFWTEVIRKIVASPFCNGENNRGWKANFDFLLKPGTAHKALEGQYDGKATTSSRARTFSADEIRAINEGRDIHA